MRRSAVDLTRHLARRRGTDFLDALPASRAVSPLALGGVRGASDDAKAALLDMDLGETEGIRIDLTGGDVAKYPLAS